MSAEHHQPPGEFDLIARYFAWASTDSDVLIGPGDDAALVRPRGSLAIATDTLVAGVHFLESIDPAALGVRILAVNLSDMAAMGARPRWFTLALTLPAVDADWLERFSTGLRECAAQYDVALIGGDMTAGALCLSVHIIGEVTADEVLRRDGAQPGDAVFVTGTLGDAAAGLRIAADESLDSDDAQFLRRRYEAPQARVGAGLALRGIASAAIDVSDGLLADLGHLCEASGCAARIEAASLPLSQALLGWAGRSTAIELALSGGDDYELCFTAPVSAEQDIVRALAQHDVAVTRIGECVRGQGVECLLDGEPHAVTGSGYEHFK
jgi:thiamine-monophosphate kinase